MERANDTEREREAGQDELFHPRLPGEDLYVMELGGGTCLHAPDNPDAYVIGDAVAVESRR